MGNVDQVLTDVVESVRAGSPQVDESQKLRIRELSVDRAARRLHARESLRATMVFYEITLTSIFRHVQNDPDALVMFRIFVQALSHSLSMRMMEAATAYTGYLLNRIHEAHLGERRRIARELHDRVGSGLSIAHSQLELFHDYVDKEPMKAVSRAEHAHQAVIESMESLRTMTVDLRLDTPMKSLEKALVSYVDSTPADDVAYHLRVNGDETWAPPPVRDESFLIVREAIRNALAHGDPDMVLISVDIAPHELRAIVEDTGHGFDRAQQAESGGTGLASMRERASLLGGSLTVSSRPGHGTVVELIVPLPGQQEEPPPDNETNAS
jgi:signal transduction histidine kinase